ncbi:4377_t:CDS:2 [Paraglomus occultum]|uniref:Chromatin modification-related protein EAF3 n=1 Tax=Paraglomus occultum TaxID=144539 RepID=A0A9N8VER9_9GLOM|nr:4377_t:CDS:2 [Paraglomus occultum]
MDESYDVFDDGMSDLSSSGLEDSEQSDYEGNNAIRHAQLSFKKDDRVLCYHGPMLYDATITDIRALSDDSEGDGPQYKVHYTGWNSKWDEWVSEGRLLRLNKDNKAVQQRLKIELMSKENSNAELLDESSSEIYDSEYEDDEGEDYYEDDYADDEWRLQLETSSHTKAKLLDDWEFITLRFQLIKMPRLPTVDDILADYLEYRLDMEEEEIKNGRKDGSILDRNVKIETTDASIIDDESVNSTMKNAVSDQNVMMSIDSDLKNDKDDMTAVKTITIEELWEQRIAELRNLFNVALGRQLLYRFERYQFAMLCENHPDGEFSSLYGAEHLLRLLVMFPSLIERSGMSEEQEDLTRDFISDLVTFIETHSDKYLSTQYENATPEYIRFTWEY